MAQTGIVRVIIGRIFKSSTNCTNGLKISDNNCRLGVRVIFAGNVRSPRAAFGTWRWVWWCDVALNPVGAALGLQLKISLLPNFWCQKESTFIVRVVNLLKLLTKSTVVAIFRNRPRGPNSLCTMWPVTASSRALKGSSRTSILYFE